MTIKVGDRVKVVNDYYTKGELNGVEGIVVDIADDGVVLPISVDITHNGTLMRYVPFDEPELEVICGA